MFVQQLLSLGYGFDERAFRGVTFQKKVGEGSPGGGAEPPGRCEGRGLSGDGAGPPGGVEAEAATFACRRGTQLSAGRSATC